LDIEAMTLPSLIQNGNLSLEIGSSD